MSAKYWICILCAIGAYGCAHAPSPVITLLHWDCIDPDKPPGQSLRAWNGGGPDGSSWNTENLHCRAEIQSACTAGRLRVTMSINSHAVTTETVTIASKVASIDLFLEPDQWQAFLDIGHKNDFYRTAIFRMHAILQCGDSVAQGVGLTPYREVRAEDFFSAGFAFGE